MRKPGRLFPAVSENISAQHLCFMQLPLVNPFRKKFNYFYQGYFILDRQRWCEGAMKAPFCVSGQIIELCLLFQENGLPRTTTKRLVTALWATNNGDIIPVHQELSTCYCSSMQNPHWHLKFSFSTLITAYWQESAPVNRRRLFECTQSGEIKIK